MTDSYSGWPGLGPRARCHNGSLDDTLAPKVCPDAAFVNGGVLR